MKETEKKSKYPLRLASRNEQTIKREIENDEQEQLIFQALDIDKEPVLESEKGESLSWFGERLTLLKIFYSKNSFNIATAIGYSEAYLNKYEKNHLRPPDVVLERLAFMFEVPKEFFTQEIIQIKINKQLKIEMI